MQSRTPATPALPWAKSMAFAVRRERRPRMGVSKPMKAARARKPAATLPKAAAGRPSSLDPSFKRTTRTSRAPSPSRRCNPIRTGFRKPRRRRTTRTRPSAMAARGSRINGTIGMSAPVCNCELRNCAEDNLQSVRGAMASGLRKMAARQHRELRRMHKMVASARLPALPDRPFYRKFDHILWSDRKPTKPKVAALEFNSNRQARTS